MTRDEFQSSGLSLVEYALLVALLCISCLGVLAVMGIGGENRVALNAPTLTGDPAARPVAVTGSPL